MIYPYEFLMIMFWVALPGLLVGSFFLWCLVRRSGSQRAWKWWISSVAYALLTMVVIVLLTVWLPPWMNRWLGLRDVHVLGGTTYWAPLGLIASVLAWPAAAWLAYVLRKKN